MNREEKIKFFWKELRKGFRDAIKVSRGEIIYPTPISNVKEYLESRR